jgi:hypothetical protein
MSRNEDEGEKNASTVFLHFIRFQSTLNPLQRELIFSFLPSPVPEGDTV